MWREGASCPCFRGYFTQSGRPSGQRQALSGPAVAHLFDDEREAEAEGEVAGGEFEFQGAGGEDLALTDHQNVGEAGGDLLDMVRDHDH
jgi:hypothetical protein